MISNSAALREHSIALRLLFQDINTFLYNYQIITKPLSILLTFEIVSEGVCLE